LDAALAFAQGALAAATVFAERRALRRGKKM